MNETSKASKRRSRDIVYGSRYFAGNGIDIGGGLDSLANQITKFPQIKSVRNWDIQDGDAQYLSGVPDQSFDFVYSSHCLEHMQDPFIALQNWIRVLKHDGYLIVSIPDEEMYEHGVWPSIFNLDHKWSFRLQTSNSPLPNSIDVLDMIANCVPIAQCERVIRVVDNYNRELPNNVDQTLGDAECAIEFVLKKQALTPSNVLQICDVLERKGQIQQALDVYLQAIAQYPDLFESYNGLANLLARKGLEDEAENVWNKCVEQFPDMHMAHLYRALFYISIGKYDRGFQLRDPLVSDERRTPIAPPKNYLRWQGEDLKDRSIVIWTEFGFGDEIMFARFAKVFKERYSASKISIVCQKPLFSLFKSLDCIDLVVEESKVDLLPVHDYWVFPHSIPLHYSLEKNGIPNSIPYIQTSVKRVKKALPLQKNRSLGRLRVGIAYKGNPTHENDRFRSIFDLSVLLPLLELPGIDWVDLQKDVGSGGLEDLSLPSEVSLIHVGSGLKDFEQTAAICKQLDLVICVDTSIAHLAGAIGIPVWLLLPTFADWRWGVTQHTTPWYPNMRIFRQEHLGDWGPVVRNLEIALCEKLRWNLGRAKNNGLNTC